MFTDPVWYAARLTVGGGDKEENTGSVTFHPAPAEEEHGTFLSGCVYASGEFSWGVHSTGNPGPFGQ